MAACRCIRIVLRCVRRLDEPSLLGPQSAVGLGRTLVAILILMRGGVFGLSVVPTSQWGGLPLSFLLSFVGLAGHSRSGLPWRWRGPRNFR